MFIPRDKAARAKRAEEERMRRRPRECPEFVEKSWKSRVTQNKPGRMWIRQGTRARFISEHRKIIFRMAATECVFPFQSKAKGLRSLGKNIYEHSNSVNSRTTFRRGTEFWQTLMTPPRSFLGGFRARTSSEASSNNPFIRNNRGNQRTTRLKVEQTFKVTCFSRHSPVTKGVVCLPPQLSHFLADSRVSERWVMVLCMLEPEEMRGGGVDTSWPSNNTLVWCSLHSPVCALVIKQFVFCKSNNLGNKSLLKWKSRGIYKTK